MRHSVGLLVLICLAACAQDAHAANASLGTRWLGVAIGEPYANAYKTIGDPTYSSHPYGPNETTITYLLSAGSVVERLFVVKGRIARVEVIQQSEAPAQAPIADPHGVALLSKEYLLRKARGTPEKIEPAFVTRTATWYYRDNGDVWAYDIATASSGPISRNGKPLWEASHIKSMSVALDRGLMPTLRLASERFEDAPLPHLRDGASPNNALRLPPLSGPANRYVSVYFRNRPCDQTGEPNAFGIAPHDGELRLASVTNVRHGGTTYTVANAECKRSTDNAVVERKMVYFTK